jgi:uncharacterized protein (DUF1778 family)
MSQKKPLRAPSRAEVEEILLKTETLNLRLSPADKQEIREAAAAAGLTLTEYLVQAHRLVAPHVARHAAR